MKTIIDKKTGKKMYPVGKWNTYQHVFYNYADICYNNMADSNFDDKEVEIFEESERLLIAFDNNVYNGMVYAIYDDYAKMKNIIGAYAYRHGGAV